MSQNRQRGKGECSFSKSLYWLFNFDSLSVFLSLGCTVEHDLDQIDYIDSCTTEEEENDVKQPRGLDANSLSSQFMAYIEQRRITHEVESHSSPRKLVFLLETIRDGVDFSHGSYLFIGLGLFVLFSFPILVLEFLDLIWKNQEVV